MSDANEELVSQQTSEAVEPPDPEIVALEEAERRMGITEDQEVQQEPDAGSTEQAEAANDTSSEADESDDSGQPSGEPESEGPAEYDVSWAPTEVREQLESYIEAGELDAAKALEKVYKSFQADYTRKTQALRKEKSEAQHLAEVGRLVMESESGQQWLDRHIKGEDDDFDPSLATKKELDEYLDRREKRKAPREAATPSAEEVQGILQEAQAAHAVDAEVFTAALNNYEQRLTARYGDQWLNYLDLDGLTEDITPYVEAAKAQAELGKVASQKKRNGRAAKAATPSGSRTSEPKYVPPYKAENRAPKRGELVEATKRRIREELGFDPDELE